MQFVYIECHCKQRYFCGYLFVPTQEELFETVVLLDYTEGSFGLDRPVHSKKNTLRTRYTFQGCSSLGDELLGYLQLAVAFGACTFLFVGTSIAAFAFVVCNLTLISAFCFLHSHVLQIHFLL